MKIPYGIADFERMRTGGYAYVDRTAYVREIEDLADVILFVRPRRFGKSLWLRTLAAYYDVAVAGRHDELFAGLAMGRDPTPLAHRYFVLLWDFSQVRSRGTVAEIADDLNRYANATFRDFLVRYRNHLPWEVSVETDARDTLLGLLTAVRETQYPIYLLIDEYDNFANEAMTRDADVYRGLLHTDGPFRELMKSVKSSMGQGIERVFITGVTPVVVSDLTSGFNIATNAYFDEALNALCGFTEEEVVKLLAELRDGMTEPSWSQDDARSVLRTWYDGYRFAPHAREAIYNPTLVLYFLSRLQRTGRHPELMLDKNLGIDETKLRHAARLDFGRQKIFEITEQDRPIEVWQLEERFTLADMIEREDASFLASYLYYFGMLTVDSFTDRRTLRLRPPNLVVKKLYFDEAAKFLLPEPFDQESADPAIRAVMERGEVAPLLTFIETRIFRALSNRDRRWNELALKTVLLTLLFKEVSYVFYSEPELDRTYADLFLMRRPEARDSGLWDLLFELKRLQLKDVGLSGKEVRELDAEVLEALEPVRRALDEAEAQARGYRDVLVERHGDTLRLRTFVVVSVGFERILGREVESPASRDD